MLKLNRWTTMVSIALIAMATSSTTFTQTPNVWMKLFNEKDLTGWKGKTGIWKNDSLGMVMGTGALTENTFLVTDSLFSDFHLKVEGRMPGTTGYRNSGIIYRGKVVSTTTYVTSGYQYELSDGGTGAFYHERGTELPFTGGCKDAASKTDWKKMEIIANGPKVSHLMNGKSCFEYGTFKVVEKGVIALQLHAPGNFEVDFRNIYIQPLNNSFQIPANNAWDSTGKQINIVGTRIQSKFNSSAVKLDIPNSVLGYDANGQVNLVRSRNNKIAFSIRKN
jgi:hypothetical protein